MRLIEESARRRTVWRTLHQAALLGTKEQYARTLSDYASSTSTQDSVLEGERMRQLQVCHVCHACMWAFWNLRSWGCVAARLDLTEEPLGLWTVGHPINRWVVPLHDTTTQSIADQLVFKQKFRQITEYLHSPDVVELLAERDRQRASFAGSLGSAASVQRFGSQRHAEFRRMEARVRKRCAAPPPPMW